MNGNIKKYKINNLIILGILNIIIFVTLGVLIKTYSGTVLKFIAPKNSAGKEVLSLLGIDLKKVRMLPDVRVIESLDIADNVVRKRVIIEIEKEGFNKYFFKPADMIKTRGFLIHPADQTKQYPAVVILHGHGNGVFNTSITPDAYNLGIELAKNGIVAMMFSLDDLEKSLGFTDHLTASRYFMLQGRPLIGLYVKAAIRVVDYLHYLDFIDDNSIGAAGEGVGGHAAVYLGAVDKRIKSVVDASYLRSYQDLPFSPDDCSCNYIPGILKKYDFPMIAAMIAPRPVLFILGKNDENNIWELSKDLFEKVILPEYDRYGKNRETGIYLHEGGHGMEVARAVSWFKEKLAGATE